MCLSWPHKATEWISCASSHFYNGLSLCAWLGCELLISSKSWNTKWQCWMPGLLCIFASELYLFEWAIYSTFPKLKPPLVHICVITWDKQWLKPLQNGSGESHPQILTQIFVLCPLPWNYWHLSHHQQLEVVSSLLVSVSTRSQYLTQIFSSAVLQEQSCWLQRSWMWSWVPDCVWCAGLLLPKETIPLLSLSSPVVLIPAHSHTVPLHIIPLKPHCFIIVLSRTFREPGSNCSFYFALLFWFPLQIMSEISLQRGQVSTRTSVRGTADACNQKEMWIRSGLGFLFCDNKLLNQFIWCVSREEKKSVLKKCRSWQCLSRSHGKSYPIQKWSWNIFISPLLQGYIGYNDLQE